VLIATFGPSTGWAGKKITREGDAFVLEDHGPISATDVMEYDRQGHLSWASDGTRAWVGSKAAAAAGAPQSRTPDAPAATTIGGDRPTPDARVLLKRILLCVIALLVVANVVLVLFLAGVFRGF
jgi:hypothetical protein